jgi:hypothetical protein
MLSFPTADLWDEQKCYDWLVNILHPHGLRCERCQWPAAEARVHRRDRAPVLYYRCACGRIYNTFAGTIWQGTQRACSQIISILQGFAQGKTTAHLARELDTARPHLLALRHRLQANAANGCPPDALPDAVVEVDEMYQNAGEKRRAPSRSGRSTPATRQQGSRTRHLGQ